MMDLHNAYLSQIRKRKKPCLAQPCHRFQAREQDRILYDLNQFNQGQGAGQRRELFGDRGIVIQALLVNYLQLLDLNLDPHSGTSADAVWVIQVRSR